MATRKQKQDLIDTLKFVPVSYTVSISGYGGEIVMGRVDPKTVDYFKRNRISVPEYASSWGEPGDEDYIDVPEDLRPFEQGSWYDCDNIEHCSGAEFGGAWITVSDENGNEVWQAELNHDLADLGCEIECYCSEDVENYVDTEHAVFVGQAFEKGGFFEAELELTRPFDPAKFKFIYSELADWPVLNVVVYDGEELDGSNGYSTTGKSSSYTFYYMNSDGGIDSYEYPEEDDSEVAVSDESVSSFSTLVQALADREQQGWNDAEVKPEAKGTYECEFENGVWPVGNVRVAEWTGRTWKENGKKAGAILRWRDAVEEE